MPATKHAKSATRSWQLSIVIDSSALVEVLLRRSRAVALSEILADTEKVAPDLIGAETVSTLRRLEQQGNVSTERAEEAIADLLDAPIQIVKTSGLLERAWQLRHVLSAYDAVYVALAEDLGCELVTLDGRLTRAPGLPIKTITVE